MDQSDGLRSHVHRFESCRGYIKTINFKLRITINIKSKLLQIIFVIFIAGNLYSQKIIINNTDKKSVPKASVTVQVYYKAIDYLINNKKEKLFLLLTDTTGTVSISGEFQKDNFKVDSIVIRVQHENYKEYKLTTTEYSLDPKFAYNIYITPNNNEIRISSMQSDERNELDIYSTNEVARKLKVDEKNVIELIETKKLKAKKIGSKYFVSGNVLRKYLEE